MTGNILNWRPNKQKMKKKNEKWRDKNQYWHQHQHTKHFATTSNFPILGVQLFVFVDDVIDSVHCTTVQTSVVDIVVCIVCAARSINKIHLFTPNNIGQHDQFHARLSPMCFAIVWVCFFVLNAHCVVACVNSIVAKINTYSIAFFCFAHNPNLKIWF